MEISAPVLVFCQMGDQLPQQSLALKIRVHCHTPQGISKAGTSGCQSVIFIVKTDSVIKIFVFSYALLF